MRAHPGHEARSRRQLTQCLPAELQEIEPDLVVACIQALPARVGKPRPVPPENHIRAVANINGRQRYKGTIAAASASYR